MVVCPLLLFVFEKSEKRMLGSKTQLLMELRNVMDTDISRFCYLHILPQPLHTLNTRFAYIDPKHCHNQLTLSSPSSLSPRHNRERERHLRTCISSKKTLHTYISSSPGMMSFATTSPILFFTLASIGEKV